MSSPNYRSTTTSLALALVFALAIPFAASAQGTGVIRGKVVDTEGSLPVPSAPITIVGTRLGGITDNNGAYVIQGVPAGPQTVRFARIGFSPQTKEVTISGTGETTVDFTVTKSVLQLEEIDRKSVV